MSYTKCISGNPYKTGSCVQGATPVGVFTSGLTTNNFPPSVGTVRNSNVSADRSGTTSGTANTATTAIPSNTSRKGFSIQNLSTTVGIYFSQSGTATTGSGSHYLSPGALYETPIGGTSLLDVSVISTSTSVPYTAREW